MEEKSASANAPNAIRFSSARGAAAMVIAMGIGRFAFTPLLPPMQAQAHFSDTIAGLLASLNLIGYFFGAYFSGRIAHGSRENIYRASLAIVILTDVLTALPIGVPAWLGARFFAGLGSGFIFVFATAFVIEQRGNSALHFSGVGLGIILSGLVAAIVPSWQTAWFVLAGLSGVLALGALGLKGAPHPAGQRHHHQQLTWTRPFTWLAIAYGLAGFGYIISGTFLVAILRGLPGTAGFGALVWCFVGLGAIISPLIWNWAARRFGSWNALAVAYVLQALSIILPFTGDALTALAAGILFGGTFTGITSVSLLLGARLRPQQANQAVARLTALYGIGQATGPLFAGIAAQVAQGFVLPLSVAAAIVCLLSLLSLIGERSERQG